MYSHTSAFKGKPNSFFVLLCAGFFFFKIKKKPIYSRVDNSSLLILF